MDLFQLDSEIRVKPTDRIYTDQIERIGRIERIRLDSEHLY